MPTDNTTRVPPDGPYLKWHNRTNTLEVLGLPYPTARSAVAASLLVHLGGLAFPMIDLHVWLILGVLMSASLRKVPGAFAVVAALNAAAVPTVTRMSANGGELLGRIDYQYATVIGSFLVAMLMQALVAAIYNRRTSTLRLKMPAWFAPRTVVNPA